MHTVSIIIVPPLKQCKLETHSLSEIYRKHCSLTTTPLFEAMMPGETLQHRCHATLEAMMPEEALHMVGVTSVQPLKLCFLGKRCSVAATSPLKQ